MGLSESMHLKCWCRTEQPGTAAGCSRTRLRDLVLGSKYWVLVPSPILHPLAHSPDNHSLPALECFLPTTILPSLHTHLDPYAGWAWPVQFIQYWGSQQCREAGTTPWTGLPSSLGNANVFYGTFLTLLGWCIFKLTSVLFIHEHLDQEKLNAHTDIWVLSLLILSCLML